jgi:hypothetical protein
MPGLLGVGSLTVRASGSRNGKPRENETSVGGRGLEVIRSTAPSTIEVLPLPPGASAAAVGNLSLNCSDLILKDKEWSRSVTIRGNASLFGEVKPRWSSAVDFPADVRLDHTRTATGPYELTREQQWMIRIPPGKANRVITIPSLVIDTFDPRTAQAAQISCGQPRRLTLHPERAQATVAKPISPAPKPVLERSWYRGMKGWGKVIAIIVAIAALLTLIRRVA